MTRPDARDRRWCGQDSLIAQRSGRQPKCLAMVRRESPVEDLDLQHGLPIKIESPLTLHREGWIAALDSRRRSGWGQCVAWPAAELPGRLNGHVFVRRSGLDHE